MIFKNKKIDNPSENADMSNEKGIKPSPKAYGIIKVTASKFINLKD